MDGMRLTEETKMKISRQHSKTEISELVDSHCEQLIGVGSTLSEGLSLFFILLSGIMYKFFIDEGVLFWDESRQDPEEDIDDGESYIDLMSYFNIHSLSKIQKIEMNNGQLHIHFSDVGLAFTNDEDLTFVKKI